MDWSIKPLPAALPTMVGHGGHVLTVHDLPPANTRRWVKSRKVLVVKAIRHGLISESDALSRWQLTVEELAEWRKLR